MNFLEEYEKLRITVPRLYNINVDCTNSDYCTHADRNKNCYLLFAANFNEDCMYGGIVLHSRDSVDNDNIEACELCYECVDCFKCYGCNYSQELRNCTDCFFCFDCVGSRNCFASSGLRQGEYYFMNKKLDKEEYKRRVAEFWKQPDAMKNGLALFAEAKKAVPHRAMNHFKSEGCTGDKITQSKNCLESYYAFDSEDCIYLQDCFRTKDSIDMMFSEGSELCYDCFSIGLGTYNCTFSDYIRSCTDLEYCDLMFNCKDCFGCVGLKDKQYYILNKRYSKEEYLQKVREIKKGMKSDGSYGKRLPSTYKLEDTAAAAVI
jgi:hypothetical protein